MEGVMAVKNFEDLNVWKQARQLTQEVYRLTKTETFFKDFGLRDQIRRAAISVMSLWNTSVLRLRFEEQKRW